MSDMKKWTSQGWIFVGDRQPENGQEVRTLTIWGVNEREIYGKATFRGMYRGENNRPLDTPSFWKPMTEDDEL